jgi:hypothetical protein
VLAWTLALAVAAGAHVAVADPAKPVMLIVVAPGADTGERAVQTIAAHLRLLGVEPQVVHEAVTMGETPKPPAQPQGDGAGSAILVRSRALASERDARGVLWVGAQKGELSIHLYERGGGRLYARSVAAERGQTAAAIESLALIARSASAELLAGKVATMPQVADAPKATPDPPAAGPSPSPVAVAEAPSLPPPQAIADAQATPAPTLVQEAPIAAPVLPAPDAPEPRPGGLGKLEVSGGYLGSSGTHAPVWRSAFALEAGWRPTPNLTFALGYEIAPPDSAGTGAMTSSFQRHPVFASTAYRFLFANRWDLELGGRGTVNVVTTSGPMTMAMGKSTLVLGSMGPTMGAGVRVLPFLRAGILLGVDVVLNPTTSYDPKVPSERLQILGGLGLQLELGPPSRRSGAGR